MSVVFLDVDHTLLKGTAANKLMLYLIKKQLAKGPIKAGKVLFHFIFGNFFNLIKIFYIYFRFALFNSEGDKERLESVSIELYKSNKHLIDQDLNEKEFFNYIRGHIQEHIYEKAKSHGLPIILISASLEEIIQIMVTNMNLDSGFGSKMGEAEFMFGERKLQKAKELCKSRAINIQDCIFYTDSMSDISLLNAVGTRYFVERRGLSKKDINRIKQPFSRIKSK